MEKSKITPPLKNRTQIFHLSLITYHLLFTVVFAQPPLYEREAFCRVTLTDAEGSGVFDLFPIEFPGGRKLAVLPKSGNIMVRFLEFPTEEFRINWSTIAQVETFNDLIFRELRRKQPENLTRVANLPQAAPGIGT